MSPSLTLVAHAQRGIIVVGLCVVWSVSQSVSLSVCCTFSLQPWLWWMPNVDVWVYRALRIVTKRESMASLIHDTSPVIRHILHNKGLYYGFRDAVLSRLVTIIKRLVHHSVYCISLSCLLLHSLYPLPNLWNFHFFTAFSSGSYRM